VFRRHKVLGKNTYPTGGDFFSNLHDLLPPLRTRPTFALDNGTKGIQALLNKKTGVEIMKMALVNGSQWIEITLLIHRISKTHFIIRCGYESHIERGLKNVWKREWCSGYVFQFSFPNVATKRCDSEGDGGRRKCA